MDLKKVVFSVTWGFLIIFFLYLICTIIDERRERKIGLGLTIVLTIVLFIVILSAAYIYSIILCAII